MDKTVKFNIKVTSNGKSVFREIEVGADDFREAVNKVNAEIKRSADSLDNLAKNGMAFSAFRDAIEAVQSVVGGLADEYNRFDQSMRSVNTMAGLGKEEFDKLTSSVERLSTQIPLAKEELANGLYQVISNGVPEDNWIEYLNRSARSAVGGIADLGQVVTVTSTIIKNYGLSWDEAQTIQDKIQTTAKNGVTSFEQLAAALPRVSGNAATLGVSIDELMASFATLTGVSGNTAEVSTQLAAIFSALVKPSSEAAKMAELMGIQFDAAAIRAAGGMKNFLAQLSSDISRYAAQTGILEQEIYGKLFGSAESLRALIPLTGELADKFVENVDAMKDSAGTMDEAFQTMAGSGEAAMQMLKNSVSNITSFAGRIASSVQPTLSFVSAIGQGIAGVSMLKKTLSNLALESGKIPALTRAFSALRLVIFGTTKGVLELKHVMRGALITSGVGVAIIAITAAFDALSKSMSSANEKLKETTTSARQLKEVSDAYTTATADAKAAIDMELASLRQLIDSHADDKQAVDELNSKYGEAFGTYQTASQWYDVLTQKSETYCRAIGMEAQARELAAKKAQNELRIAELQGKMKQMSEAGTDTVKKKTLGTGYDVAGNKQIKIVEITDLSDEYKVLRDELNQLSEAQDELTKKFEYCTSAISEANKELQAHTDSVRKASEEGTKAEVEVKLNGLDETRIKARLQQVQQAIDAAPTLEKKLELQPEKQQLEQMLADIRQRLDNAQLAVRIKVQQERDKAQGTDLGQLAPAKAWEEVQADIPDQLQAPEIVGADRYTAQLTDMQQQTTTAFDSFKTAWGGMKGIGEGISSITTALEGNANAWQTVTGIIDGIIRLYESFNAIVGIAETFGLVSKATAAAKTQEAVATIASAAATTACAVGQDAAAAATVPVIAANKLAAASYMELATAAYMAAHAYIPFLGFGIASGFAAAAKAEVLAMGATPFAEGGLLYGPTLALAGEYAGAGSNPEVIAPLDKLRSLINTDQGGESQAANVTFRLQGRELLGLMEREGQVRRRR